MIGKQRFLIVVSVLAIVLGGIVYLFQVNKLARVAPEFDRIIRRHVDRWSGVIPPASETVLKVLEKDPKFHSSPNPSAKSGAPGTEKGPPQRDRLIYTWIDENGVRHFTDTAPPQSARDVKVITAPVAPGARKQ